MGKAFFHGGDYHEDATLWWGPKGNGREFTPYIEGYFHAANLIAASSLRSDLIAEEYRDAANQYGDMYFALTRDTGVFPMLFLYRHYIEIALKDLIRRIYDLQDRSRKKNERTIVSNHSLRSLAETCRGESKSFLLSFPKTQEGACYLKELQIVIEKCDEIDKLDRLSSAVRYPVDKEDNPYLVDEEPLNIALFMEGMQQVHEILSHGDYLLSYHEEMHAEMLSEYSNEP